MIELQPGKILELDAARVKPFAGQPRKRFRGIKQLAESIRLIGQVTPIIVTPSRQNGYDAELVDGERRLRACRTAGLPVKAVLMDSGAEADRYTQSVAANFCGQSHDAVEIMHAVIALRQAGRSILEVAGIFGKTPTWVSQYSSLKHLAPEVLRLLEVAGDEAKDAGHRRRRRGRITLSVALLLVGLPKKEQVARAQEILRKKMSMAQARTVVRRRAAKKGSRVGRHRSPREGFSAMASAVENAYWTLDRYVNMPGVQINTLIRAVSMRERSRVASRLKALCDVLATFSDVLDNLDAATNAKV